MDFEIGKFYIPATSSPFKSKLPRPKDFSKALYTIDIGQNDLGYGFQHTTPEKVVASIPDILGQLSEAIHVRSKNYFGFVQNKTIAYNTVREKYKWNEKYLPSA